ncbi:MAG: hypothetical protein AAF216_05810 [Pseudomonadota bacterium]
MTLEAANLLVSFIGAYFVVGLIVALMFAFGGAKKIDPGAAGMPFQARLIILPGIIGIWPLMLHKFFNQSEPPVS